MGFKDGRQYPVFLSTGFIKRHCSCKYCINIKIRCRLHLHYRKTCKYHIHFPAGSTLPVPCQKWDLQSLCYSLLLVKQCIVFHRKDLDTVIHIRKCTCFPFFQIHVYRKIKYHLFPVAGQFFSFKAQLHLVRFQRLRQPLIQSGCFFHLSRQGTCSQCLCRLFLLLFRICEKKEGANEQYYTEQQYQFFCHSVSPVCIHLIDFVRKFRH